MRISDWSSDVCSSDLPLVPRILEIGCGTGLLTRDIRTQWLEAELTVTDLAPEMVERAARDPRLAGTFFTMDGEWPCFEGQWFDLIISSLAFQWRSEAHTSELQSLMRISYAVFCLKKKKIT